MRKESKYNQVASAIKRIVNENRVFDPIAFVMLLVGVESFAMGMDKLIPDLGWFFLSNVKQQGFVLLAIGIVCLSISIKRSCSSKKE
jgi:hypothetical protein